MRRREFESKSPVLIMQALGHSDLRVTMRYVHLAREHLRPLVEHRGGANPLTSDAKARADTAAGLISGQLTESVGGRRANVRKKRLLCARIGAHPRAARKHG